MGVIGCGAMGKGIVKNFVKAGYEVFVFDPNPQVIPWIKEIGAVFSGTLKDIAEAVDIMVSSLPTTDIVRQSYIGENGVFNSLKKGSIIIDMSTTDAETAIDLAKVAEELGLLFYDCPVSGGPAGADSGTLTIMVGGNIQEYEKVLPILEVVGEEVFYIGESGAGQITKLCHNMVVASTIVSLGEALIVAKKAGVEPEKVAEVFAKGTANRVLNVFGENILNNQYDNVLFSLNHMHKDIWLYTKTAISEEVPSFIGSTVFQLYESAKATGKGNLDATAVCQILEELASTAVSSGYSKVIHEK
ncbi:NAD(P)-dependent oxidoreductase [Viridibacillus soli]|uniref:NAD(P)-dependent oxidoreductase n=1 Tax=Viridibacillus soli TaxID=2798301 RepID=UPI002D7F8753|nr:NAD(P)-dependent oxidoreductase [Viridibacillus soli]